MILFRVVQFIVATIVFVALETTRRAWSNR